MTQPGSSSSSFSYKWTYDVFLSFRGKDTRTGFTGNLYNALRQKGFHTFIDDAQLTRGEEIKAGLFKAIERSRIAVVVFSEDYASSRFCLDELVNNFNCIRAKGRMILPVFYKVDPSQVRHQTGSYGRALANHEGSSYHEPKKLKTWRSALNHAANLSGFHYDIDSPEDEYVFIGRIIKEISNKINRIPLYISDYPVGLESRILEVYSLLDVESNNGVYMVGIYGIGGIGKSTIARAVYNLIAQGFEGICFLSNVREKSTKQGLEQLQETLLSELTGERDIKFVDVNKGISVLKSRLNQKKVLLVLDDVDKPRQLEALAGGVHWFGSGSRIIITTRDTHLLSVHKIKRRYHMTELNHPEALELFNWKAFKRSKADPKFKAISERIVLCGHGLPLALEVMGSNLYGKSIDEWNSALEKYEENSNKQVQEVLEVSYNSLEQDEKEIFLDIACFFNGETLQYVKNILIHSRGLSPEYAIGVLIEKSLIKIIKYWKFEEKVEMHHLIQDMGQNIVKLESPLEPGGRSRLWFYEDIIHVLEEDTGTDKIQFMMLNVGKHEVQWSGNEFKKMKNLRVLIIKDVKFSQYPKYLPNSLRVLDWEGYPSSSLPSEFHPRKLGILNLRDSFFTWDKAMKKFEQLKVINFIRCNFLKQVPDLSESPNLIELHLDFCKSLTEIHDSVGFLVKLRVISAKSCVNLKIFPRSIKLKSLESLNMEYCSSLNYFPEISDVMENLSYISFGKTAIEELPSSIQNVTRLVYLNLSNCRSLRKVPTCILMSPVLEILHVGESSRLGFMKKPGEVDQNILYHKRICLWGCNFLDGFLPTFLGFSPNMTSLELSGSNFTILPECIQSLKFLIDINLDNCKQLQEIRGLPENIEVLSARNCTSLMPSALNILLGQNIHSRPNTRQFTVPGIRTPKWVDHYSKGGCLSFWFRNGFPDIALLIVGGPKQMFGKKMFDCGISVNGLEVGTRAFYLGYSETEQEAEHHTYLYGHCRADFFGFRTVQFEDKWNHSEISFSFPTRIYIYDRARIGKDVVFTDPKL